MLASSGQKKKKKRDKQELPSSSSFLSQSTPSHSFPQGGICTADQCGMPPPTTTNTVATQTTTSTTTTFESLLKQPHEEEQSELSAEYNATITAMEENELSNFFPAELYDAMKSAARQGMLTGFLLTLTEQMLTDYLKSHHYQPEQIYLANLAMRALTLITIGTSPYLAIGLPVASYLISMCGFSHETANQFTMGGLLVAGLLTNPFALYATALIVGMIVNTLMAKMTKETYGLAKNSIFAITAKEEKSQDTLNENLTRNHSREF